jgi:YfiH family protein
MDLVRSRLLAGFPHGFTTRAGGVSRPPYDALNLGGAVGDDPAAVEQNWSRLRQATGLGFARVRQVHGARVVRLDAPAAPSEEADAVVTAAPGVAATVSVADCVPVLLADPVSGAVAAVHAGWRGTLARVVAAAVAALRAEYGARPGDLLAAIGPSIGPCCYEVSEDLARQFEAQLGPEAAPRTGRPRPHLDLWAANERVLRDAGVGAARVERLGRCTACEREVFFSHRRDAGTSGRQVGFVAPRPAPAP